MNIIITITVTALVVLYAGLFKAKKALLPLTLLGLLVSLAFVATGWNADQVYYGMMQMDNFALAFTGITVLGTLLIFLLTQNYFAANSENIAEYFTLILFALAGIVIMVSYKNMSMLFIGVEIMSVSLYILAGIRKSNFASNEASLKYFLMGAFSTGFLLFGITLIYGATGSFDLDTINQYLVTNYKSVSPMFYPGIILLMIGLSFKIGAAPFHFWTPDVYEGAPTLITTFMSTIVKTAGFAAFLRLFAGTFAPLHDFWMPPMMGIVCLTLLIGNVTALFQKNFNAWKHSAFEEFKRRAAASRDVIDAVGNLCLVSRRYAIAAADNSESFAVSHRFRDSQTSACKLIEFEYTHRAVPKNGLGVFDDLCEILASQLADVQSHPAIRYLCVQCRRYICICSKFICYDAVGRQVYAHTFRFGFFQ